MFKNSEFYDSEKRKLAKPFFKIPVGFGKSSALNHFPFR
jgi:hypothetical protein